MKLKYYYFVLLSFALTLVACDDDPVLLKDPVSALSNDCIKRSLPVAPNIVGNEIEFAYAITVNRLAVEGNADGLFTMRSLN